MASRALAGVNGPMGVWLEIAAGSWKLPGDLPRTLVMLGISWMALRDSWRILGGSSLAILGILGSFLEILGGLWRFLEVPGDSWSLSANPRKSWRILENPRKSSSIL